MSIQKNFSSSRDPSSNQQEFSSSSDVLKRIEMRHTHAISNLKLRKSLFDHYNQQRKAWSNVRASYIQKNINLFHHNPSELSHPDINIKAQTLRLGTIKTKKLPAIIPRDSKESTNEDLKEIQQENPVDNNNKASVSPRQSETS